MLLEEINDLRFRDSATRIAAVNSAARRSIRPELVELLVGFNKSLGTSSQREENLEALSKGDSAVVVAGQQTGLFLGPLYTLYKALSAVKIAAELEKESGKRVVPIFWLQTEDHDFEEIRKTNIQANDGSSIELSVNGGSSTSRMSIEHYSLAKEIEVLQQEIAENFSSYPATEAILEKLAQNYQQGTSFSQAFAGFLAELTKDYGLLFYNPRNRVATSLTKDIYFKAISEHQQISKLLAVQGEKISAAGFKEQVFVRENSPLFFFHKESEKGERFRIEDMDSSWSLVGVEEQIAKDDLTNLLETSPERFSSSALLRPIIQDSLFPTAAVIVGEAERSYFRQITPLYELFNLPRPLVIPRAHFLCLEEKARKLLSQLQLSAEDLKNSEAELLEKLSKNNSDTDPDQLTSSTLEAINQAFVPMEDAFSKLDPTLVSSLNKNKDKIQNSISALKERYIKALATGDEVQNERLKRLMALIHPGGNEQERVLSPLNYLCRYGEEFTKQVYDSIEAYSEELKFIEL